MMSKHVLITGGNKGIGLKTTQLFLDLNFKVTVLARNTSSIKSYKNCSRIDYDLSKVEGIKDLISSMEPVDILINNAGIMNTYSYSDYPNDKKDEMLRINLEAPVELITHVSQHMIKNNYGRIVNNTSIAGQIGHPDIWYGMSKAALINATKSFAKLLGPHGIVINAIAPGPVKTDLMNVIPEERKNSMLKTFYSNRFAEPEEIAKTILWLATESPEYINGTCLDINNGAFP